MHLIGTPREIEKEAVQFNQEGRREWQNLYYALRGEAKRVTSNRSRNLGIATAASKHKQI